MKWRSVRKKPADSLGIKKWRDSDIAREIFTVLSREHYDPITFSIDLLTFSFSHQPYGQNGSIRFRGEVSKDSEKTYDNIQMHLALNHRGNRDYKVLSDGLPYTIQSRINGREGFEFIFKPSFQAYQGGNTIQLFHWSQYHLRDYMKPNDKMLNLARSLSIPEQDGVFHFGAFNLLTRAIEPTPGAFMKNLLMLSTINAGYRRYRDFPDLVRELATAEIEPSDKPERKKRKRKKRKRRRKQRSDQETA